MWHNDMEKLNELCNLVKKILDKVTEFNIFQLSKKDMCSEK